MTTPNKESKEIKDQLTADNLGFTIFQILNNCGIESAKSAWTAKHFRSIKKDHAIEIADKVMQWFEVEWRKKARECVPNKQLLCNAGYMTVGSDLEDEGWNKCVDKIMENIEAN